MASIKDVAKKAGVSTATVSRVLNNHPSVVPETRRAVRDAMDYLCYVPNKSAIQLSGKCSGLIAVVLPNLVNPHFCELLATFEEEARYIGKTVIVKTHQNQPQQDRQIIHTLIGMGIDSLLWVPTEAEAELAQWLTATHIPVAVVTQVSRFFNSVSIDQSKGAENIAEHFIQTGHTALGFIAQEGVDNRKVSAWSKKITGHGIALNPQNQFWIAKGEGEKISGHISILDDIIEKLVSRKTACTGLMIYNDVAASYIIDGLSARGLCIPQDIAIVSFDNTLLAQTKKITSIAQPINEIFTFCRGADGELRWQDIPSAFLDDVGIVHFGAATGLLDGELYVTCQRLLYEAKRRGLLVSFDPNYRDGLWGRDPHEFITRCAPWFQQADIVKVSEEELHFISGMKTLTEGCRWLHDAGVSHVTVTCGRRGTWVSHRVGMHQLVPSVPVDAIDSTGAGDAFIGALLAQVTRAGCRLDDWSSLLNAVRWANICGALTCTRFGAIDSIPVAHDVDEYLASQKM